jgi:di/tricarboxylate transporter
MAEVAIPPHSDFLGRTLIDLNFRGMFGLSVLSIWRRGELIEKDVGVSCAFVPPFAHQWNLMVMGFGGYKTFDFVKVGTGLSIVMAATAVVFLSL